MGGGGEEGACRGERKMWAGSACGGGTWLGRGAGECGAPGWGGVQGSGGRLAGEGCRAVGDIDKAACHQQEL